MVAEFGIPSPEWSDDHVDWVNWPRHAFIEIQLWSDEPIASFIGRPASSPAPDLGSRS